MTDRLSDPEMSLVRSMALGLSLAQSCALQDALKCDERLLPACTAKGTIDALKSRQLSEPFHDGYFPEHKLTPFGESVAQYLKDRLHPQKR